MRTMFRGMVGLGLAALLAAPAMAQGQGRGGFGMMGGGGISMMIGNSGVQKEIKLDDTQTEKVKKIADENREKFTELRTKLEGLEGDERRTKQQEFAKEINASTLKALGEFLKPEQLKRLHEVTYQVSGANAFSDPEVVTKLSITDAQKDEIKTIVDESRTEMREIFSQIQDDREAGMKKLAEHRKETLAKVVAKLNDEQKKTWNELIGAPFEFKPDPPRQN
jgi:Spy/CpxP family protein refolding chaperone